MHSLWRDLVHAVRSLARARAFTFVCVITLGFGMAPSLAIQYAMRIFTTPPQGVNTEGLVELVTTRVGPHEETAVWSYPDFDDLRAAPTSVTLTGFALGEHNVTLPESKTEIAVDTMFVTSNYFRTIGVALARGTEFSDAATSDPAVILGYRFWQRRLSADPDV